MQLHKRTIIDIAEMICGAAGGAGFERSNFRYRSSTYLTEFFVNCDMDYAHDGSTRKSWVVDVLTELNTGPTTNPQLPSDGIIRVIQELLDAADYQNHGLDRSAALADLNTSIGRDGLQAYLDGAGTCHVRNIGTQSTSATFQLRKRSWTNENLKDEYDSYIPQVFRILNETKNREEIREYLRKVEDVDIGIRSQTDLDLIIDQLLQIEINNT